MIDDETAEQGMSALAVATAEIMEDAHEIAVTSKDSLLAFSDAAKSLGQTGADIAALAAAIEVIAAAPKGPKFHSTNPPGQALVTSSSPGPRPGSPR